MTKIGVGVGEDFPIEDRPPSGGGEGQPGASSGEAAQGEHQSALGPGPHEYDASGDHRFAGCGPGGWDREEWRAHRADWRRNRRQWKAEHREWRRRFKAEMRARIWGGEFPRVFPFPFLYLLLPMLIGLTVFAILVTGVVTLVASAPFVILGLALLFILYAAHRRHYRHGYRYYDATPTDAPPSSTPPAEGH